MMVDEFTVGRLTDELNNYLDGVQLSGVFYVLASGGTAKADLSSEVGHVIDRLVELLAS